MSVIDWLVTAAMLASLGGLAILVRESVTWCAGRRGRRLRQGVSVVVQCWGFSARGAVKSDRAGDLALAGVELLDESAREPKWTPLDGELRIPAGAVRFVQVL